LLKVGFCGLKLKVRHDVQSSFQTSKQ